MTYPGIEQLRLPEKLLGCLPSRESREKLSACWADYLAAICDTLRQDWVCTLGDNSQDTLYKHSYGNYLGKWASVNKIHGRDLLPFIGTARHNRVRFTIELLKRCGVENGQAEHLAGQILESVFEQFVEVTKAGGIKWLEVDKRQTFKDPTEAIRIRFSELGLRFPLNLWRCRKTGHVWPRSVLGSAPMSGSIGTLERVTHQELDEDPRIGRVRREYQTSEIFKMGLWAEEHSAQLSPSENRRIQKLFKAGVRNIISSTTTMELGIDIGGLNAIFLSNVPPGKANYLQRAGRAGRRTDGSSVVVTYISENPFDREVFYRFGDYLSRPLRQPVVLMERERIARRHFNSMMLGEFFKSLLPPDFRTSAMGAYGQMGSFCGVSFVPKIKEVVPTPEPNVLKLPEKQLQWLQVDDKYAGIGHYFIQFLEYVKVNPSDYRAMAKAKELLKGTPLENISDWEEFVNATKDDFSSKMHSWIEDYNQLLKGWELAKDNSKRQANAISYQLRALYETTVIEVFADRQVLPKYGFPVNVHRLKVLNHSENVRSGSDKRIEDRYRLERGGLLALREYVPGSQLLVGGMVVTSRGILKHFTGANVDNPFGEGGLLYCCKNEHITYTTTELQYCPECNTKKLTKDPVLIPKHGFSTAAWDEPYVGIDVEKVGDTEQTVISFQENEPKQRRTNYAGIKGLTAIYQESGEILVYNRGENGKGFHICEQCGYAESIQNEKVSESFIGHAPLDSENKYKRCMNDGNSPINRVLASKERTDLLLLDFSDCLGNGSTDRDLICTLGYALKLTGAKLLGLDSRELGVLLAPTTFNRFGAVIFDNVPGGAGHVLELMMLEREWLTQAQKSLYINDKHHRICKSACLDCLLTFESGVKIHQLCREKAYEKLSALLNGESIDSPSAEKKVEIETTKLVATLEERKARLLKKRR